MTERPSLSPIASGDDFKLTCSNSGEWDFPGGPVDKKPPANVGDTDSIPDPGRTHVPQSD